MILPFGYPPPMRVDFTKMHGLGNDFIVFDAPAGGELPTAEQWRRLSARNTGIGFDQALVLESPRRPDTVVFYHFQQGWARGRTVRQRCPVHRGAASPSGPRAERRAHHG